MTLAYVDTSALAKRYHPEPRADDFDAFLAQQGSVSISRLTVVEFRCLTARRRRANEIDSADEARIHLEFDEDVQLRVLEVQPIEDRHAIRALQLLARLAPVPLRTLDAMHLAIAQDLNAGVLATADRVMAAAGAQLGFQVLRFD